MLDAPTGSKTESSGHNDRKFITSLARGLEVLRAFRARDGFLGNSEISERTGLPKPTVSRLTHTLCELGYLTHLPRINKYRLAPAAITLGYSALANLGVRNVARPFMSMAAETLAAPIALGVLDRHRALYLDIARGSTTFTVQLDIGSRIPLAKTAMGWALLAALDEDAREDMMDRLADRHGSEWQMWRQRIDEALADYSEHGFVVCSGAWRSDINAVGVPLIAADGTGIFAFNCGGPPNQFTADRMKNEFGPALRALVAKIDRELSGETPYVRP